MPAKGDRSLTWEADIDLSKFKLNAKNIETIMAQLGKKGFKVDTSGVDQAFEQSAQTAKKTQTEVVNEVEKASAEIRKQAVNVNEVSKALEVAGIKSAKFSDWLKTPIKSFEFKDWLKGIPKIDSILPENFVPNEESKVRQVVDFSKEQLKELQAALSQNSLSVQTTGKNIPRPAAGPNASLSNVLSPAMQQTLSQAQQAFSLLDEETKQYVLDLVDMQAALAQAEAAQKRLSSAFGAGKIDQKEYTQATAALKKAQEEIQAEIKNQTTVQETSLNLQNLQTNTLKEKKQALTALRTAYSNLTEVEQADATIGGQMKSQIIDLNAKIKEQSAVVTKSTNILTEYRNLRNKIASDSLNGIVNQEDIQRAGQMEVAITDVNKRLRVLGSSTSNFEAVGEGFRGISGAISIASGALAVFGDDSQETQKLVQGLTSAMFAFYGAQSLVQVLNKNSKLNTKIREWLLQKKAVDGNTASLIGNTVATEANTVAEGTNIVAKEAEAAATTEATAAQWSLNSALAANPVGVVLVAVTALISAIALFSGSNDKATESQKKLNDELERAYGLLNDLADLNKLGDDIAINAAQHRLDALKAEGAGYEKIISAQKEVNELTEQSAKKKLITLFGVDDKNWSPTDEELKNAVDNLRSRADEALDKASKDHRKDRSWLGILGQDIKNNFTGNVDEKDFTTYVDKEAQEVDDKFKDISADRAKNIVAAYKEYTDAQSKGESDLATAAKDARDRALASDSNYWKAKVTIAQKGTKEWLDAQLKLNQAEYNNSVSNPNATAGQISLAMSTKQKADLEANKTYNNQKLKDDQDRISAELDQVKTGSAEELNLKLQLLEKQRQVEINNAEKNAAAIEKINADSLKKRDDLKAKYAQTEIDRLRDLQINIAKINLNEAVPGSESALAWTKDLANKQALKQIGDETIKAALNNPAINPTIIEKAKTLSIDHVKDFAEQVKNIDNDLGTDIERIWSDTNKRNLQSDQEFISKEYQNAKELAQIKADIAKQANNAIINDPNSSSFQVATANLRNNGIDQRTQQSYLTELKKTYREAAGVIDSYVNEVEADFNKLGDLKDPASDINAALDNLKVPEDAKKELLAILTTIRELIASSKDLQKQKITAFLDGIGSFANEISNAGQAISNVNKGLGETLISLGEMTAAAGSFGKALSTITVNASGAVSGDPLAILGGALSLFTGILSANAKIRQQQAEAAKEEREYQKKLILGQIQYNQYISQHRDIQDAIVRGMREELKLRLQLNNATTKSTQQQLHDLTELIEKEGKIITGYDESGWKGIGTYKKTPIYGKLGITDNMSIEEIEKKLRALSFSPKITEETKAYVDQWLALYDAIQDANKEAEQFKEQLAETFAGTTADNIAQSIIDGLKAGKRSFEDFADDINALLSNSIFASIKETLLNGAVKDVWQKFYDYANDPNGTGQLTQSQIAELQAQMQAAITQGVNLLDQAKLAFPDLEQSLKTDSTLTGQIKGITQDQASELAGLYRNMLDVDKRTLSEVRESKSVLNEQLTYLQNIEKNTANTVNRLDSTNKKLDTIITNTKTQSLRDLGS